VRKGIAMARRSAKKTNEAVRQVCFELLAPAAQQACLAGNFNGWDAGSLPMTKDVDGNWRASVALKPGSHEYRFVVDGIWQDDPKAQRTVANSCGSRNCVVEVS
jgi:1,4-alpha-glucan branching enzyme